MAVEEAFLKAAAPAAGIGNPIAQACSQAASPQENKCSRLARLIKASASPHGKAMGSSLRKAGRATGRTRSKADRVMDRMHSKAGKITPTTTMTTITMAGVTTGEGTAMAMVVPMRPGP
ncbi:MAG: hypothetical protein WBD99_09820 [Thermodesulfobacteriota bacterium]